MINGYIVDMDGTLVDSMALWDDLGSRFLRQKHITPKANLKEILAPLSINQAITYLINEYHLSQTVSQISQEINMMLETIYTSEINLKPGAADFIEQCFKQNKKLCLLTANNYQTTIKVLNKYNLTNKFDQIITCDNVSLDKQNGAIYEYAAEQLGVLKDECIVIEDAYHAITSAKDACFKVWAVADLSNQQDWDKICQISDLYFNDMREMEVLI